MNLQAQKTKIIAGTATVLLIGSMFTAGNFFYQNKGLITENNAQKLTSEKLLSEKLLLDKEIINLRSNISSLSGKNSELDKFLLEKSNELAAKEAEIAKLTKENKRMHSLQKQLNDIKKIEADLNKKVADLNITITNLRNENAHLTNNLAFLENENELLNQRIKAALGNKAGNFRIDVMKGRKDKLTVRARQTDKIAVSFDLPENAVMPSEKKEFYLVVTSADGVVLTSDKSARKSVQLDEQQKEIIASFVRSISYNESKKRISMAFEPNENLKAGVYKIDLFSDTAFLGSGEVSLRK